MHFPLFVPTAIKIGRIFQTQCQTKNHIHHAHLQPMKTVRLQSSRVIFKHNGSAHSNQEMDSLRLVAQHVINTHSNYFIDTERGADQSLFPSACILLILIEYSPFDKSYILAAPERPDISIVLVLPL